jgi:hypothetical protein
MAKSKCSHSNLPTKKRVASEIPVPTKKATARVERISGPEHSW